MLKEVLSKAPLTALGQEIRARFDSLYSVLQGHAGELSPLGEEQQRKLALRMRMAFPEVFRGDCRVSAVSSDVPRCVRSMECFLDGLKQEGGLAEIDGCMDPQLLPVLKNGPVVHDNTDSLFLARFDIKAVYSRLFVDVPYAESLAEPLFFVRSLYYFCAHLPSAGIPEDPVLKGAFTLEEWKLLSYLEDEKFSLHGGWSRPENVARIWPLLENFVNEADSAIASGKRQVRLRFGHDNALIPFMAILELPPFDVSMFKSADCPMAANVRWIFAKNHRGEVTVKVQYNESDVSPWMPWEDFRQDCIDKVESAKQLLNK